jgi:peptidyl-prolyl cis-trans isomerase D
MFDPQRIKAFESQVDQADPTGKAREEWETLKKYVVRNALMKKYAALVSGFAYTPKFALAVQEQEQNEMASMRYVKVPFTMIPDGEVKITDEDLVAYMKKREPQYKLDEPTRSIEYVSFDVIPTAEDTARSKGALEQLKAEFAATTDNENFVNRNSDDAYVKGMTAKTAFMSAYADSIYAMPAGVVYGPYYENGSYKMTKLTDKRTMADSVKCRHVLVKTKNAGQPTNSDSTAKSKIDSAIAAINGGIPWADVVNKFSEDDGSKQTAGEYTFTLAQKAQISKEFGDFIFDGKVGEKKMVKVDNQNYSGYHYIEILSQTNFQPAAQVATISKAMFAGDNTESAVYSKATEFAGKNATEKAFDETIKKENLNKRMGDNVKANDFVISGIGSAREIVRWMYEAKVGDVSQVFALDGRYIVAKLSSTQEPGLMKLDANMRPAIENMVRAEKKAELIKTKYKGATSLDAISQASGQPILQADSFNASNAFVANLGYEPKAVGYAFNKGFALNTMSPAIKGQDGVIYISVTNRFTKAGASDPATTAQMAQMMDMQMKNSMGQQVFDILRKKADIKYNPKNL